MRRNILPLFALICVLAILAFFAWLTHHPDAEIVRRAQEWPVVGPWASHFRQRYLPPQPPAETAPAESSGAGPRDAGPQAATRPGPGAGSNGSRSTSRDLVWVLPGAVMRRQPSPDSKVLREFDAIATVIKLDRRGDWFHVRQLDDEGWIFLEGYDERGGPPYGEAPEPVKALMPRPPDAASLGLARELLGDRERVRRLGPYATYSDFDDRELFDYLDALAAQIEELYSERYDLEPLGDAAAAVVLYRSELPYRVLERRSPSLVDLHSAGHASRGLAVLYAADRDRADVGATLIHELVHFLNRRALGPALPPWIDEGLADALAMAGVGDDGRLVPSALGGSRRQIDNRIHIDGALAALYRLRGAILNDSLPSLERLTRLDWDEFVRSRQRQLNYDASAFWIRYLLDGDPRLGAGLRRFLAGVAVGEPATDDALRRHLDRDWATLDAGFRRWIESHPALPHDGNGV